IMVLERRFDGERVRFAPADRAWLAALLHPLPRTVLTHLRLLVRPDTVLRWHRDLIVRGRPARRSRPRRAGRPRTIRSIRTLVLCLALESSGWRGS
ncbi:MAG TPA: integrase, partial [Actinoplanes sp.]|nr:integrase [Actinoplanes sp.]